MPRREDHHAQPLASSPTPTSADALQDPALLRRLLRAKDRMDAASHEAWPVKRLAEVSGVSEPISRAPSSGPSASHRTATC
jgi:hypothetical protein